MKHISTIYYTKNDNNSYTYYDSTCAPKGARPLPYHASKTIKVQQADGSIKVGYMYGEKSYSYDAQEVVQYREEQARKRQREAERRAMLNTIMAHYEAMDTETLTKIVASL